MTYAQDTNLDKLFRAAWHYKHCTIERQDDPDSGTTAWCEEHKVIVTEVLPDYGYEPDIYENQHESDLL